MHRPSPQEIKALRGRYAAPGKPTTKLFKVYDCGKVVFENESPELCWGYIHQWNLKTKPTLK